MRPSVRAPPTRATRASASSCDIRPTARRATAHHRRDSRALAIRERSRAMLEHAVRARAHTV
jgi:hypothetical protein